MPSGLNEKSKGNEAFLDVLPGARLDKIRQEKLKRFREILQNKFSTNENDETKLDENRIVLNLPWKDHGDYSADDSDHQRYLRTLNASIFLRIKSIHERLRRSSFSSQLKSAEEILYHETLIHLNFYSNLSTMKCLGFERFIEKENSFEKWFETANNREHFPFVVVGARASGKTLVMTKLVQHLTKISGKQTQVILRYFNLTSRSRHINELFASITSQMRQLNPQLEQIQDRIECFEKFLEINAALGKPLILMIDGIEDLSGQNLFSSSIRFYQTLFRSLPAKVKKNKESKNELFI